MVLDEQVKLYGRKEKAIEETLRICQSRNVLREYLRSREQEVKTIMGELFNQERATELYAKEIAREAAKEAVKEANERADRAEAENRKLREMLQKLTGKAAVL